METYHYAWLAAHPYRSEDWLMDRLKDGFHIHHIDGNHGNDLSDNLVLIEANDHLRLHGMNTLKPVRAIRTKRTKLTRKQKARAELAEMKRLSV